MSKKINSKELIIIIPAYNPDEKLIKLVNDLKKKEWRMIIVDDGSALKKKNIFEKILKENKNNKNISLIKHSQNMGKGAALKTAMKFFLKNYSNSQGVITIDADGQHDLKSIEKIADYFIKNPHFVIGERNLNKKKIPFKSFFGNKITKSIFKLFSSFDLEDTQCGLRVIPKNLLPLFLKIKVNRYDFEMEQLFICQQENIKILTFPIETIYIENNQSSHFNAFVDSFRIYKLFFKFSLVSISSFLLDNLLLIIFLYLSNSLIFQSFSFYEKSLVSLLLARTCSALFNFLVNKNFVFKVNKNFFTSLRYILLVFFNIFILQKMITFLFKEFSFSILPIKIAIDILLFFLNYFLVKKFVFKK